MVEIEVGVSEVDKNDDQWGFNHEKVVLFAWKYVHLTMKNALWHYEKLGFHTWLMNNHFGRVIATKWPFTVMGDINMTIPIFQG